MDMSDNMEILAPTMLEYWAVRSMLPHACTSRAGVRLARWKGGRQGSIVVVCGLAGALVPGLPPGTVLVPDRIGLADGGSMRCDPVVVQALVTAAHMLRLQPVMEPLVTVPSLVVGADRHDWARRGFVAVDMETGLLAGQQLRVATVRVVLDGPEHEISPDWLWSPEALRRPALWRELFRLSRVAPYYALRAAHVLKTGVGLVSTRHTC